MVETVAFVPSDTIKKTYNIFRDKKTGNLSCDCPSWRYQRKPVEKRRCKHIIKFLEDVGVL